MKRYHYSLALLFISLIRITDLNAFTLFPDGKEFTVQIDESAKNAGVKRAYVDITYHIDKERKNKASQSRKKQLSDTRVKKTNWFKNKKTFEYHVPGNWFFPDEWRHFYHQPHITVMLDIEGKKGEVAAIPSQVRIRDDQIAHVVYNETTQSFNLDIRDEK